ncbi:MAG: hypothetical protein LBS62_13060 [Clostridiales bacterium]|jgi:trigger factor|nr:hypothetical protein [Clostridiales bacterium]
MGIFVKNYKGLPIKKSDAGNREAIIEKLLAANDIDVPQELVDKETAMLFQEYNYRMRYEKMMNPGDLSFLDINLNERAEELKAQAYLQVKADLIIEGIIDSEGFEITRDEMEEAVTSIAKRQHMDRDTAEGFLGGSALLKRDLLVEKALDFVCANARIEG